MRDSRFRGRAERLVPIALVLCVGWASCNNNGVSSKPATTSTSDGASSAGGAGGTSTSSGGNGIGGSVGQGGAGGSGGASNGGASGYGGDTSHAGGAGLVDAAASTDAASGAGGRGGLGGQTTSPATGGSGGGSATTGASTGARDGGMSSAFALTSSKLPDGGTFPTSATCEASTPSSQLPPLAWTGAPAGTKSFALVFVDVTLTGATPPNTNGFHSAMWNIPAGASSLPEGLPAGSPPAGVTGLETVQQKKAPSGMAFLGPCPNFPSTTRTKTDTYQFRLYAVGLDSLPGNTSSMTIQQIYDYLEGLPPLGLAILSGTSNTAATSLK